MANVVDDLFVNVGFKADIKGMTSILGQVKGIAGGIAGGLSLAATAAVGTASAITGLAIQAAMAEDATAKLAGRLKTTTEELTALQHAADHAGVSQGELVGALKHVGQELSKIDKEGSGSVFSRLHVSAKNADGTLRSTVDLLPEIADRLAQVKDESKRAALAQEVFGGSSQAMAGMIEGGGDAMRQSMRSAHEMGIVLSSVAAKNSEELVDSLTDLKAVSGAMSRQFLGAFIPAISRGTKYLTALLTDAKGLPRVGLDKTIKGITWALEALSTPLGKAALGFTTLAAGMGAIKLVGMSATLAPIVAGLKGVAVAAGTAAAPFIIAGVAIGGVALLLEDLYVASQGGESAIMDLAVALGIGDSFLRGVKASVQIVSDVLWILKTTTMEVGANFLQTMGTMGQGISDLITEAAKVMPILQPIADWVKWMGENLGGLGLSALEGLAGFTSRFRSGELGETEAKFASAIPILGEQKALLESARQREITGEGMGLLGVGQQSFTARNKVIEESQAETSNRMAQQRASAINVAVTAGVSAREQAQAAADAVYREVLAQSAALEALR